MESEGRRNHLAGSASPYLLSHADNPVHWYPWGEEAFDRARREDKPIFLSIGYNACHWCHVMERESFSNNEIADLLNEYFVCIKVDREERPDVDQIYMVVALALTGSGGWPLSVFLTPDRAPFFAGTYFPPDRRWGRPGFKDIVLELGRAYRNSRDEIVDSAQEIVRHLMVTSESSLSSRRIDRDVILAAGEAVLASFDRDHGGFGGAPKFPQPTLLSLLFRAGDISGENRFSQAALFTLRKMARGGIYDQVGGGFHRYSVDAGWMVPHFEKMLYDNALLVMPYIEAYQISGDAFYLRIVRETLDYLLTEMADPAGPFYCSQDADSEGEEGRFYTWSKEAIAQALGTDADWFCRHYGITENGNFEKGRNILRWEQYSPETVKGEDTGEFRRRIDSARERLRSLRRLRVVPAVDDKILASWNGLAISALVNGSQVTGDGRYLKAAEKATGFILQNMYDGRALNHSWHRGRLMSLELLEDYAYFVAALLDLYQAVFDEEYLNRALVLARRALECFYQDGKFYLSSAGDRDLIFRPRELTDGAMPSPASVMIMNLLRLAAVTGDDVLGMRAREALEAVSGLAARTPQASGALIAAGDFAASGPVEIVLTGMEDGTIKDYQREIFSHYLPNKIVVGVQSGQKSGLPLLADRQKVTGPICHVCRQGICRLPVSDPKSLRAELDLIRSR